MQLSSNLRYSFAGSNRIVRGNLYYYHDRRRYTRLAAARMAISKQDTAPRYVAISKAIRAKRQENFFRNTVLRERSLR